MNKLYLYLVTPDPKQIYFIFYVIKSSNKLLNKSNEIFIKLSKF